jgi:hypothetical protein
MRYGRALLAGLGWAGVLGGVALCVLIFLSAYLAFDDDPSGVDPRKSKIVRLPAVREADVPRVPLARPPGRLAGGGTRSVSGARAVARRAPGGGGAPRSGTNPPATAPVRTPPAGSPPPVSTSPPPVQSRPRPASPAAGGAGGAPQPTLGDATSGVVGAVGTEVGRVSPPAGEVIRRTGDTLGDAVDTLVPRLQPAPR